MSILQVWLDQPNRTCHWRHPYCPCLQLGRAFSLSFLKVKGKGHYLDEPLFTISEWSAPSIHDLAGWIETGLIFIAILLLARMAKGGMFLSTLSNEPNRWLNLRSTPNPIFSILTIILISGGAYWTEAHYRSTENGLATLPRLEISLEDPTILTTQQNISRQVAAQLHYEEASSTQWQDRFRNVFNNFGQLVINPNTEYWQAFEARWDSGVPALRFSQLTHPSPASPLLVFPKSILPLGKILSSFPSKLTREKYSLKPTSSVETTVNYLFLDVSTTNLHLTNPICSPGRIQLFLCRIDSALGGRRNVGGTMLALALANVDSTQTAVAKLQPLPIGGFLLMQMIFEFCPF